jgi:exopolysaccharide production protein ExoZ
MKSCPDDSGGLSTGMEKHSNQSHTSVSQAIAEPARPRLDALQGLRGCAALLVVIGHSLAIFRNASGVNPNTVPVDLFGALGVYAFFVVSGFLMVYVHGGDFGHPKATRTFYARRIARIIPLYWVVTISYGIKQIRFGQATVWEVAKSLLFIPYQTSGGLWRPVLGQGWTLNYEMLFYAIFGLALIFARGQWIVFGIFGTLVILNLCDFVGSNNVVEFWSNPIILYFLAGVAIGLIRTRATRGPSFAVAFSFALAALAGAALFSDLIGATSTPVHFVVPLVTVAAVAVTALAREDSQVSTARRLAKRIGDASYSIYLTHTFVIAPAAKIVVAKIFPHTPIIVFTVLMIAATAIVGYLVFRLLERPLIKLWTRMFIKRPNAQTTTPAVA